MTNRSKTTNTISSEANSLIDNVAQKHAADFQDVTKENEKCPAQLILRSECSNNVVTIKAQLKQQQKERHVI